MRFGVIATENFVGTEFEIVAAADDGQIVREFVAAENGEVGQENVRSQVIDEAWNLESHLGRGVRDHVEMLVIPLRTSLVLGCCTELAIPGDLEIVIVSVKGASR